MENEKLYNDIKLMLGNPLTQVELTEEQFTTAFNDASESFILLFKTGEFDLTKQNKTFGFKNIHIVIV